MPCCCNRAAAAQSKATTAVWRRCSPRQHGIALQALDIHRSAGFDSPVISTLRKGDVLQALPIAARVHIDGTRWWQIDSMYGGWGWIPEAIDGAYTVEPFKHEPPVPFDVPMTPPIMTNPDVPVPTVAPQAEPPTINPAFAGWDGQPTSPTRIRSPPTRWRCNCRNSTWATCPCPGRFEHGVHFVTDANLNAAQLALLAQRTASWSCRAISTSSTSTTAVSSTSGITRPASAVHHHRRPAPFAVPGVPEHADVPGAKHVLRRSRGFPDARLSGCRPQYQEAVGTPEEQAARNAAVYYAVPLMLIAQGETYCVQGYEQTPVYAEGALSPSSVIAAAGPASSPDAQPLVDLALAGEGREAIAVPERL
ncbi:MAG: hypothetical protein U0521_02535 [Anaerolineae bacterium]